MDFLCYLYTKVIITLKDAYMMKQGSMRGRFQTASTPQTFFYLVIVFVIIFVIIAENDFVIVTDIQFIRVIIIVDNIR